MTKRRIMKTIAGAALPAFALALGACAMRGPSYRDEAPTYGRSEVVTESYYPQRVHYYEPNDTTNIYYIEQQHPDVVVNRTVYRETDGRTYYIERQGNNDRHVYFDDKAARSRKPVKGHDQSHDNGKDKDGDHDNGRGGR